MPDANVVTLPINGPPPPSVVTPEVTPTVKIAAEGNATPVITTGLSIGIIVPIAILPSPFSVLKDGA